MTTPELQAAVDELLIALADNLNERVGKSLNTILTALEAAQKELGELRRDKETWEFHKQVFRGFSKELTGYFVLGGLFNPEMANHDAVSDLLMRIRKALDAAIQKAT